MTDCCILVSGLDTERRELFNKLLRGFPRPVVYKPLNLRLELTLNGFTLTVSPVTTHLSS